MMTKTHRLLQLCLLMLIFSLPLRGQSYKSAQLEIRQISAHVYQHISYLKTEDFGDVQCNGMIVINNKEAVVFDTPADNNSSLELIEWMKLAMGVRIKAIIPTHFHADCLGGLAAFHKSGIPSYAYNLTIEQAKQKNFSIPQHRFNRSIKIKVGDQFVEASFQGAGHTRDNVVGYYPAEGILFGGCLVKEAGAGKGNLEDADIKEWPSTIRKVKDKYSKLKIVIPGHGKTGDAGLLDYTLDLFTEK